MKLLLQNTLQAILDAEMASPRDVPGDGDAPTAEFTPGRGRRKLPTRLGPVVLQLPQFAGVRFLSRLFQRYAAQEMDFLLLLGRTLARGYGTPATTREMAEKLCGHMFARSQIAAIAGAIERELPDYFQREFERGHGYTGAWRNAHPRSGIPQVRIATHAWIPASSQD